MNLVLHDGVWCNSQSALLVSATARPPDSTSWCHPYFCSRPQELRCFRTNSSLSMCSVKRLDVDRALRKVIIKNNHGCLYHPDLNTQYRSSALPSMHRCYKRPSARSRYFQTLASKSNAKTWPWLEQLFQHRKVGYGLFCWDARNEPQRCKDKVSQTLYHSLHSCPTNLKLSGILSWHVFILPCQPSKNIFCHPRVTVWVIVRSQVMTTLFLKSPRLFGIFYNHEGHLPSPSCISALKQCETRFFFLVTSDGLLREDTVQRLSEK